MDDPETPQEDATTPGDRSGGDRLLERARDGDRDALAALLERHRETLRRFAECRLPPRLRRRVSAADVVQEACLVAMDRCAEFEPRGDDSFRNWLMGIVDRKVREAVRAHEAAGKRSLRHEVSRGDRRETRQFAGREPSPSQAAVAAETDGLVDRALARLTEEQREVLVLTRREHLTLDETARRTGRSYDAVRKLLARALGRLAEEFERVRGADSTSVGARCAPADDDRRRRQGPGAPR